MNVTYTEKAKQSVEHFALLQKATKRMEEALKDATGLETAVWDLTEDGKGGPLYVLRLKDSISEVTGRLASDEIQSPAQTSFRVYRLYGKLLQNRTQKQLDKLMNMRAQSEN